MPWWLSLYMTYKFALCYVEGVRPHEPHIAHAVSGRAAFRNPNFRLSRAFCTPDRDDASPNFAAPGSKSSPRHWHPEMTLPRPMGRSTPSPAGARTEHRSPRVVPPLRARFPSVPKWPVGACQLTDSHRCIPDCHTPHRKKRRPFQGS